MKLALLVINILIPAAFSGVVLSPAEKPIKFLVLERSDLPDFDQLVDATTDTSAGNEAVTENVEVVTEQEVSSAAIQVVEDTVKGVVQLLWDPMAAWRELNFPIVPEGEASFETVPQIKKTAPQVMTTVRGNPFADIKSANCRCGKSVGKVVGGDEARVNDIPWTVALVRNGFFGFGASRKPYCGGTLINNLYVLTASHCVDGLFAAGLKVWLNEEDYLITSESSRQEYFIDQIIMHQDYDRRTVNNDIALLKLTKSVAIENPESSLMVPSCVPANNDADFAGLNATVAGWGLLSDGGKQSNVLRKVTVPVMTNEVCNSDQTKYKGRISENMMCAGFMEGGKDSCQGDSGGPLIIDNSGRSTLIGIVSWGFGCAAPQSPGVYTRVGRYVPWILEHTKEAAWCRL